VEPSADLIADLQARVRRHRPERYPIQHATAQFHLGVALTNAGRTEEAVQVLTAAARLLHGRLPVEEAKAMNALGAALRLGGRRGQAITAFAGAAATFERGGLSAEQGAALFNLGLAHREERADGSLEEAIHCFARAGELLRAAGQPRHAAAAVRENGAALLVAGRLDAASAALAEAVGLAERAGDWEGHGAALNALGLAHLSAGRSADAITAFRAAASSHPRGVRPEGYAMGKSNLAVAYEAAGAPHRARLAARQALAAPRIPTPVARQAAAVLERIGDPAGDLPAVLEAEPMPGWPGVLREEMVRWAHADPAERRRETAAWLEAQLRREATGTAMCEVWLGALLELPPSDMEALIHAALEALAERDAEDSERFHTQVSAAMARFHLPQWMRLKETFNRLAAELGSPGDYG